MKKHYIFQILICAVVFSLVFGTNLSFAKENAVFSQGADNVEQVSGSVENNNLKIYLFFGSTCPHCKKAEVFLNTLKEKYQELEVVSYEVFNNKENADLLLSLLEACGKEKVVRVPVIFIGEEVIVGYNADDTTGIFLEKSIKDCFENGCSDPIAKLQEKKCETCDCGQTEENCKCDTCNCKKIENKPDQTVKLPIIGSVDLKNISLPLATIILGTLDGFNPCAMWVLVILVSLILASKSRKRILLIGGIFIFIEGLVYFLIMAAWLNVFLALSFVSLIRIAIGIFGVVFGVSRIRDFIKWKPGVCKVTEGSGSKDKIMTKINKALKSSTIPATIVAVAALAFSVNLVEFFCSAGFPTMYTRILALQNIGTFQYYLYLIFYNIFYMLDDLIVFGAAFFTLNQFGFSEKYNKYTTLAAGILILILGVLMIFKPEFLMFG